MKKTTIWLFAVLVIAAVGTGFYIGYWQGGQEDRQVVAPADPTPEPAPAPTTPQQPPKTPAQPTTPPQPDPQPTTPPAQQPQPQPSDAITIAAYSDTGSLSLAARALQNSAFQIERLDWEAGRTLYISGNMRAFEAVGNYRVRDENKQLLEPEQIVRAREGAPAWSPIKAAVPLKPEYKGKTLLIEFFTRSPNDGSRTNMITVKVHLQ